MSTLQTYEGCCHCQALKVRFESEWSSPSDFALRECDCSFCRRHGARTARDPAGRLTLFGQPHWYRFGMGTADFLLCPACGVYMGAVVRDSDIGEFATLNVNCLDISPQLIQPSKPVSYGDETDAERVQRRLSTWTPFQHEPIALSRGPVAKEHS